MLTILRTPFALASFIYFLCSISTSANKGRIVGGKDTTIEQHPWQLSLQYQGNHNCGAAIISSEWALTAAHCMAPIEKLSIRSGSTFHAEGGTIHKVSRIIPHEKFDKKTIDYDIAVVKVVNPFDLKKLSAIYLAPEKSSPSAGTLANVTGWGLLKENGMLAEQLQEVVVPIVSTAVCKKAYASTGLTITDRMLCAGHEEGGKNSCTGDSGSPLVINKVVYGVVSFAIGCARPKIPTAYAHVGNLRSWISEKTGI